MFDLNTIAEFSRSNCLAICAVMVPVNLISCLQCLILVGLNRPKNQVNFAAIMASIYAIIMLLHVGSWFVIGVVRIQTFILLSLACICLIVNTLTLFQGSMIRTIIFKVIEVCKEYWSKVTLAFS